MCATFIIFSFILVVMQRHTPTSHPVGADAPLGGGLTLLQQAHPRSKDVCYLYFFSFILVVMQRCTPTSHPVGADASLRGELILLQQAHPRSGDVCYLYFF
jgi:hypothetical protein